MEDEERWLSPKRGAVEQGGLEDDRWIETTLVLNNVAPKLWFPPHQKGNTWLGCYKVK